MPAHHPSEIAWLFVDHEDGPPMFFRMGQADTLVLHNPVRQDPTAYTRADMQQRIVDTARWAIRTASMAGTPREKELDPNELVDLLVVGLLGYPTVDGLPPR